MPFSLGSQSKGQLLKHKLAAALRQEILSGGLSPGEPVVETQWAPRLGVAQASIREAINILTAEGFIEKEAGKSARVILLAEADVAQIYRIRAVLEGLAARLAAEAGADMGDLEQTVEGLRSAAQRKDLRATIEKDLSFHLLLAEKSANRFLANQIRQLLVPLFAFTLIRASKNPEAVDAWLRSVQQHQLIVDAIRSGDPAFAEHAIIHAVGQFAEAANDVWVHEHSANARGTDVVDIR